MDTATATPRSRYQLHPFTNLRKHEADGPLVITRGDGVYVYDEDRHALPRRHGRALVRVARILRGAARRGGRVRQMCELPFYHSFGGKVPAISTELAERLIGIAARPAWRKVLFANSGSEANDTAIKLAWYVNNALGRPRKKKIISRQRAYHGVTDRQRKPHRARLRPRRLRPADRAHPAHRLPALSTAARSRARARRRSPTRLAANLEQLILREDPDTVAAFFAEPVMGAGGVIVPPATYFDRVQPILKKYDILFVVDEVICGFGRTGHMFGSQTFDLQPDIMTVAKALSAGYLPISATLVSEALYEILLAQSDKLGIFGHGYTYSSHPVPARRRAGDAEDLRPSATSSARCGGSARGCRRPSAATPIIR